VRPLLSGRDYHALHRENTAFDFAGKVQGGNVAWRPYRDRPSIVALSNATFEEAPLWYRSFAYQAERDRGLEPVRERRHHEQRLRLVEHGLRIV
jgi:hypothetical protein